MQNERSYGAILFSIVKGVALALAFSFLCAVIFASILRFTSLPDKVIYPVNQGIKLCAVVLGALVFVRGEKGWLQGLAIALLFTALSYLAFSAIGGSFAFSWLILLELLIAVVAGVLSGALSVNLRR